MVFSWYEIGNTKERLLPPAYVVRREGNVFSLSIGDGGTPCSCPWSCLREWGYTLVLSGGGGGVPPVLSGWSPRQDQKYPQTG